MGRVTPSLYDSLCHAVGDLDLATAAKHLTTSPWSSNGALTSRLTAAFEEWEGAFEPPALMGAGRLRPLVTGQHGVHHVASPRPYSPYDDEWDEATAPTRSLHWYFNDPGRGDTSGHRVPLSAFLDQVKHYLLYSDAIAFEFPEPGSRLTSTTQLARLLRLCHALEPLLRDDIVVLVPNNRTRPEALADAERTGWDEFRALYTESAADDPLGPLSHPYTAMPAEWFSSDLRDQRFQATAEPLVSALTQLDHYGQVFDLHTDAGDLALLRAMLRRSALSPDRVTKAQRAQQGLILKDLSTLSLPIGTLAPADIVAIRSHGQFEAFRTALRRSIAQVAQRDYSEFFDPRAQALTEIQDELRAAEDRARREVRNSKWLRTTMLDSTELTVVSGLGAAGALLASPLFGAGLAAGGFFATKMLQWLRGRPAKEDKAFARHIAVFDG
ncbi:hypothetical protein [Jiangella mangrovi]|uniref:Uncharacterized protein n=1 Tax=Jiangella mangrovi TaxID=1524084 RepID=A0A7W9LNL0_9ACTN|nr:hypothetical protein [Jiangella mangrovi]MBB5790391.1 hypothetical protein [Jiangella mangrovi]